MSKNLNSFGETLLIAGPCSAETPESVESVAASLAGIGVKYFRAGAWKPRTTPGNFEGYGEKALPWIVDSAHRHNLVPMVEIATVKHAEQALQAGISAFWLGARTVTNPFAVQDVAEYLAKNAQEAFVLVKNPVNPDLELWMGAIERLRNAGISNLGAIHRGFSCYDPSPLRNEPFWRIPLEFKRRMPDIPLICDPSHIAGKAVLVPEIAQTALDMAFNGLMVEVHSEPCKALSDAEQQLTPVQFKDMLNSLKPREKSSASHSSIERLRDRIDRIDDSILTMLASRNEVCREIAEYKRVNNMPVVQQARYERMMAKRMEEGNSLGLNDKFVRSLLALIHEESVKSQIKYIKSRQINDNNDAND